MIFNTSSNLSKLHKLHSFKILQKFGFAENANHNLHMYTTDVSTQFDYRVAQISQLSIHWKALLQTRTLWTIFADVCIKQM